MKNYGKYRRSYFTAPIERPKWIEKEYIDQAPVWCSVDLRDGNQALERPMDIEQKTEFFKMLVSIGFKEIEVGFPAASDTEYAFVRSLIDGGLIPDDVTIQVMTQAREHIIKKTFASVEGAKKAIIHLMNPTSAAQREQVFKKNEDEVEKLATDGAKAVRKFADRADGEITLEYTPESFTATEPEYALRVCNAVLDAWEPSEGRRAIINLPVTVELSLPHIYANQVEYICENIKYKDFTTVSVHSHNDRGCGVADTELGLLAGAKRVEGTLFGNGERTGNADLVTLAMNMYSHGVDPKLNFENLPEITEICEHLTGMAVDARRPYSGRLVFTAFSGSHQDAIAKGMRHRKKHPDEPWAVPYLPIDPTDIGRNYADDVIRINSQSGSGGIGYIMQSRFGYTLPKQMCIHFRNEIKSISDKKHTELKPDEILAIFERTYLNIASPVCLHSVHYRQENGITATVAVTDVKDGRKTEYTAEGNGRLDSVANALRDKYLGSYQVSVYEEHSLTKKSDSQAAAYICITSDETQKSFWGVGTDNDIINASVKGLISAVNNKLIFEKY